MMTDHDAIRPVLVGYDGTPGSEQALRWALEEACLRAAPLVVCHAWHWPYPFSAPDRRTAESVRRSAAAVVDEGVTRARELLGEVEPGLRGVIAARGEGSGGGPRAGVALGVEVRPLLAKGAVSAVLLAAARDCGLIVLGSRTREGLEDLQVGSAALQIPAHSVRPVIVVRPRLPEVRTEADARIVVGVDGSPASRAALAFAYSEALLRGASVTAVCGWWDTGTLPGPDHVPFAEPEVLQRAARVRFEEAVAPWTARHPEVPTAMAFVDRPAARALIDHARGAALLVLGDRGEGSAAGELLGPVTQAALYDAPCPVAVTPLLPDTAAVPPGEGP